MSGIQTVGRIAIAALHRVARPKMRHRHSTLKCDIRRRQSDTKIEIRVVILANFMPIKTELGLWLREETDGVCNDALRMAGYSQ